MPEKPAIQPANGRKVLVAMSGGVDSSVTAALLSEQGFEVVGCFMRNGAHDSFEVDEEPACDTTKKNRQGCCSVNDAADARLVAAMLEIPFYVMNFKRDFGQIMDYFTDEYNAGRTPNPCVRCNDWLKFGKLMDYADSIDAAYVATGHYARVDHTGPHSRLLQGIDSHKDQSYVLFGTKRQRLERMMLPIGDFHKTDVRQMAEDRGLPVFNKPDSYEICFVPDNDYRSFLRNRSGESFEGGEFVDTEGKALGKHDGHQNFTIGQRRGLGVTGELPLYVIDKNATSNTVTLGVESETYAKGLTATQCNWLIDDRPTQPTPVRAKIRSNSPPVDATVNWVDDDQIEVRFDEPQKAVSPGQAVACYKGEQCLGGGWIDQAL